ncbi:hypothetical protein CYMTET_24835 [Cymbomonas tetramitiformis]|uniref:Importin N-terminal domain-containing protein n=1 Tax=Cymbomonas tetramitiformis TaxID=36881 RepID=A0AAE0FVL4_9CHLO|nr:hypothetical protein CYMTET_24835 [Cymbomonas tetramitiformis]
MNLRPEQASLESDGLDPDFGYRKALPNPVTEIGGRINIYLNLMAEQQLAQLEATNYGGYLTSLAFELASEGKPADCRKLAGLILKNCFYARDMATAEQKAAKWAATDAQIKAQIRQALLAALVSQEADARDTSAQVIGQVAGLDIPKGEWSDLTEVLLANMNSEVAGTRESTLKAFGYACEELDPDSMKQEQVDRILTAVAQGGRAEEPSAEVRCAGFKALLNSLDFAAHNFENEHQRGYVMHIVGEGCRAGDLRVQHAAFECLVAICDLYYETLPAFIHGIFSTTQQAIPQGGSEEREAVAMQAVEVWSTICEVEISIDEDDDDDVANHHFAQSAAEQLLPLLLAAMQQRDLEAQDLGDEEWNLAAAAEACLELMSRAIGDAVLPLVVPFIQANLNAAGLAERRAAVYALGAVVEGPEVSLVLPLATAALPLVLSMVKDPNVTLLSTDELITHFPMVISDLTATISSADLQI